MFGLKSKSTKKAQIGAADAAFELMKHNMIEFAKEVADRIAAEFRAGRIDDAGVAQRIEFALEKTASAPGVMLPRFMWKQILQELHIAIITELAALNITVGKEI